MKKGGGVAWLGLAAYIAAYDYYACKHGGETMSGAFGRALAHKQAKLPALLIMGLVVKHLAAPKILPQIDPLNRVANRWRLSVKTLDYNFSLEGQEDLTFPRVLP